MPSQSSVPFLVGLLLASIINEVISDDPEFNGLIQGIQIQQETKYVAVFKGIRYANVSQRFAKATPLTPETTSDAWQFGSPCAQLGSGGKVVGAENCLFLNVYVPHFPAVHVETTQSSQPPGSNRKRRSRSAANNVSVGSTVSTTEFSRLAKLPVYIFINGQNFAVGSGENNDPSGLSAFGEVIVVTFNYRLGALGFLTTDTEDMPRNLGFLDQEMAIQWVRRYAHVFGGDLDRITVGGQSAGAVCAVLLSMQAINRDLFQNVIAQSGTPLTQSLFASKGLFISSAIAADLKCEDPASAEGIKTCLKSIPLETLLSSIPVFNNDTFLTIKPVLDIAISTTLFSEKNLLIGYNHDDGEVTIRSMDEVNLLNDSTVPSIDRLKTLISFYSYSETSLEGQAILDRYVNWENSTLFWSPAIQLSTDKDFAIPSVNTALFHAGSSISTTTPENTETSTQTNAVTTASSTESPPDATSIPQTTPTVEKTTPTTAQTKASPATNTATPITEESTTPTTGNTTTPITRNTTTPITRNTTTPITRNATRPTIGNTTRPTSADVTTPTEKPVKDGKTYLYFLNLPALRQNDETSELPYLSSPNAAEVPYFFGESDKLKLTTDPVKAEAISRKTIHFLAAFIKTGIPSLPGTSEAIEEMSENKQSYVEISDTLQKKENPSAGAYHFIEKHLDDLKKISDHIVNLEEQLQEVTAQPEEQCINAASSGAYPGWLWVLGLTLMSYLRL